MPKSLSQSRASGRVQSEKQGNYQEALRQTMERIGQELDVNFSENPFRALRRRVILATSGSRVGSHLLIDNLYRYGVFVDEFFNLNRIKKVSEKENIETLEAYCRLAFKRSGNQGIFGVKGARFVLAPLTLAGEFPAYKDEWSFIYLWRADLVRQAVSLAKARISGAWNSTTRPVVKLSNDEYDADDIRTSIENILEAESRWRDTFNLFEIKPMSFSYEDLVQDPLGIAGGVAKFANLDGSPLHQTAPPFESQSDELNDAWSARFREEYGDFCRELDSRVVLPA